MRWPPWKKKNEEDQRELARARANVAYQKALIAATRAEVDAIAGGHQRVIIENHLADAVRNAFRNNR
jgi:hypothetical protein